MAELKAVAGRDVGSFIIGLIAVLIALGLLRWGDATDFGVGLGVVIAGFGLWFMARSLRSVLALVRAGEPVVSIPVSELPLGGHFVVTYEQRWSRAVNVQRIIVQLVLRETVQYTSGSSTRTDTHDKVVQRLETQGRQFERGEVRSSEYAFHVPLDGMHTFAPSEDNRIEWYVTLDAELARWPDMHREYEITVLPRVGG